MFHLFSNHSSANNNGEATSRVNDNGSTEEIALSIERLATYDEMLSWLLPGAVAGF
jgi:hypothetical protein